MTKHWYRVDVVEAKDTRTLIGTSELDPAQIVKNLRAGEYLVLNDLSYRDNQNRIVPLSNWDPRIGSVIYVNPQYVTTFTPLPGDPRSGQADAK